MYVSKSAFRYNVCAKHFTFKQMPADFVFIAAAAAAAAVYVFGRIVFRSTSVNDIVQWNETADTWSISK